MSHASGTDRLFVDVVRIEVRGGRGGDGCVSFRREKFIPKGGPDGGDGGHGGSVFLVAKQGLDTLLDLAGRHHWRAVNGRPGSGANRFGKSADDLIVPVPIGTLVYDDRSGRLLKDLIEPDQRVCVARGGRGGHGNARYATSVDQAPRFAQPGRVGQERMLRLELKLIADVGLVGMPNAGKSTLLSRLTNARPKIAAYPFTTKEPQLGIAELSDFRRLVLADIPGLIEGAHGGAGLGDAFLRHIERTRVIVHLVDLYPPEGSPTPIEAYHVIRRELELYSPALASRAEILVATKLDLASGAEEFEAFQAAVGREVIGISGVSGVGLRVLLERLWSAVEDAKRLLPTAAPDIDIEPVDPYDGELDEAPAKNEVSKIRDQDLARALADDADEPLNADDPFDDELGPAEDSQK